MNIIVSACLLGENCKYNGGNNRNSSVIEFVDGHRVIAVCPELLSGIGVPRDPVEIVDGHPCTKDGRDVTALFQAGILRAMEQVKAEEPDLAVLQSRSPSCGVNHVYDGSFSGRLITGMGMFAKALAESGIRVLDAEDLPDILQDRNMPGTPHADDQ